MEILAIFLAVLALLVTIGALVANISPILWHFRRSLRNQSPADFSWWEMVYEGSRGDDVRGPARSYTKFSSMTNLKETISTRTLPRFYRDRGVATFVWHLKDDKLRLYVGVSNKYNDPAYAVNSIASSIGARADKRKGPPELPIEHWVVARRAMAQPKKAKTELKEAGTVARSILESMSKSEGESAFIASFEMMRNSENNRLETFLNEDAIHRGGDAVKFSTNSHGMVSDAVRICFAATSDKNLSTARSMLNAAAAGADTLGWDIETLRGDKVIPVHANIVSGIALATGVAALVVSVISGVGFLTWGLAGLLIPAALIGARVTVLSDATKRAYEKYLRQGEIVVPPYHRFNIRWTFLANRSLAYARNKDNDDKTPIKYALPSHKQVLTANPATLYALVSWPDDPNLMRMHSSRSVGLPKEIASSYNFPIYIGVSGAGQPVAIDIKDVNFGLYCAGSTGSGKSNFLQVCYTSLARAARDNTGGMNITPMWFETKGEGAHEIWRVIRREKRSILIDSNNPGSKLRLALEGPRISDGANPKLVVKNCRRLVSGMQYAMGDAIKASSRDILDGAFRIAMLLSPDDIKFLEVDEKVRAARPNIIRLSLLILGKDTSIDLGPKLLQLKVDIDEDEEATERERFLSEAIGSMSRFFDPQQRRNVVGSITAPLNKLSSLADAEVLWEPKKGRVDVYMPQIIKYFGPVVVSMGSYRKKTREGYVFDSSISMDLARTIMRVATYLLWEQAKTSCSGWDKQNKRLALFCDELADIAVKQTSDDVPNIVAEILKEGRSKGTSLFAGSQHPGQIPQPTNHNIMSMKTKMWFSLQESSDAQLSVKDLSSGATNSTFTTSDIKSLPVGTCFTVMKWNDRVTPPFTLSAFELNKWAEHVLDPSMSPREAVHNYMEWDKNSRKQMGLAEDEAIPYLG